MPATLDNLVFDSGLDYLDTATTVLYVTSAQATTYTEAATTFKLGTKTALSIGAPTDGTGSGRMVVVASFTDGVVDSAGTATHFAITTGTTLLVTQALASPKAITTGSPFELSAIEIEFADPV